jgi:AcrR family transcriptional regulator
MVTDEGARVSTHGWRGDPPRDADEARERVLRATRDRLAEAGSTTTSEVAERLGVTRQTVYRYYATTEELLTAASLQAVGELEADLVKHVQLYLDRDGGDAGDAAVEVVAFVYEHLRDDHALNRLIAPGRMESTLTALTSDSSITLGRSLLDSFPIDWPRLGIEGDLQRELVEYLLRTLQSLVLDPGSPPRSSTELRAYLQRWLAPALRARSAP